MNGWILKRKVGAQLYEFKFPRGMVLKAGATTTVRKTKYIDFSREKNEIVYCRFGVRMLMIYLLIHQQI